MTTIVMDEDAKLLFPDLTSSSTGASEQVLHDVSLNASPPGRSGLDIDPSIQVVGADEDNTEMDVQHDQREGPGTNIDHSQEHDVAPQTADGSGNAIRYQGGQDTFANLDFRLDSLGTPLL